MKRKIRIPKEKMIAFNTRFVYFLDKDKVFRGNRNVKKSRKCLSCLESTQRLLVVENSIKKIEEFWKTNDSKLGKILKRHGVKLLP